MKILVTNDDGIDAAGLKAVASRLAAHNEVWVVAPDRNRSGVSHCITMKEGVPAQETDYICSNTNGSSYYVYRPQGLSGIVSDIIALPSGLYQLSYTSALKTEYGRKYLPVEVETYLLNRSGRDESGYFAPLE